MAPIQNVLDRIVFSTQNGNRKSDFEFLSRFNGNAADNEYAPVDNLIEMNALNNLCG